MNQPWIADHVFGANAAPGRVNGSSAIGTGESLCRGWRDWSMSTPGQPSSFHDIPLLAEVIDDIPFAFDHIVTVKLPCMRLDRMVENAA